MFHETGKRRLVGLASKLVCLGFHRGQLFDNINLMLVCRPNPKVRRLNDSKYDVSDMILEMNWIF